jgi:hypothetical protein
MQIQQDKMHILASFDVYFSVVSQLYCTIQTVLFTHQAIQTLDV